MNRDLQATLTHRIFTVSHCSYVTYCGQKIEGGFESFEPGTDMSTGN